MLQRVLLGVWFFSLAASAEPPRVNPFPPCSGLANWGRERYLVTHDLKEGQSGARIGELKTAEGCRYRALEVDWGSVQPEGNDIESICPVDGLPGSFLVAESGFYRGKYGRVFWMEAQELPTPRLRVLGTFQQPQELNQEIEGLATRRLASDKWLVLLGGRGGKEGEAGRLFWGTIERDSWHTNWSPEGLRGVELQLPRRLGTYTRTLSDMYLDDRGVLWACTCTAITRQGPFRSMIYQAGTVETREDRPFTRARENQAVWWIDGCKAEGLAPSNRRGWGPAFVTDDEDLGGIWRAVPATPSLNY